MKRDEILRTLKEREADLRAHGVTHAALFGSVARDEQRPDSDIDILVDLDGFPADDKTFYAATRCLEIISEASRRLPPAFKERFPEIPWKDVAGSGNIYRHNYESVQELRVWKTIHEALPQLRAVVDAELQA